MSTNKELLDKELTSGTNKELLEMIIAEGTDQNIYESELIKELAKRVIAPSSGDNIQLDRPKTIANWIQLEIGDSEQEHFVAIYLDKQNNLIDHKILFTGTLDRSVVHPRDIFREAVKVSASRIILAHNHPSGSISPSQADIETTEALIEAGKMMGIFILDHLIVARGGGYSSIREYRPDMFI